MSKQPRDVTTKVSFGDNDGELMPLFLCVCGKEFEPWEFILHLDPSEATQCPCCKRRLYFSYSIHVYAYEE